MRNRIIVSASSDLGTDQRVLKICTSLHEAGYEVFLIGRLLKNSLHLNLSFPYHRIQLIFNKGFLFYAELNIRLFLFILFRKADLLYANDTDTITANFLASELKKIKVVFDAHELFPEVPELVDRPRVKAFWTKLEDIILPRLKFNITVCESIAKHYNQKYGSVFEVVRNVPYFIKTTSAEKRFGNKKVLIYQGAINVGRGLELVIDAMKFLPDVVLWIIGDGDIKSKLKQQVQENVLTNQVIFEGKVDAELLRKLTMSADIGLCLLENKGLSYYYSLPNRIFDYLHAGIPVLTTPFPEISNIVNKYHTGITTQENDPAKLAMIISNMLENPIDTNHFEELSRTFCWEKEQNKLLDLIKKALC